MRWNQPKPPAPFWMDWPALRLGFAWLAVTLITAGCMSPAPKTSDSIVLRITGDATITQSGASASAVRAGTRLPVGAELDLGRGASALVGLPYGSTVEFGQFGRAGEPTSVAGIPLESTLRIAAVSSTPSPNLLVVLFGTAHVVHDGGSKLSVLAGDASISADEEAEFDVFANDSLHGDATISATKGGPVTVASETLAQPQELSAGDQVVVRTHRGH